MPPVTLSAMPLIIHVIVVVGVVSSDNAAIFYIDGHVRVYSGDQTKLPKHYVARQKLCLRATVDY